VIVLGIETSGETASVAIRDDEVVIASRAFPSRMSLCQRLAAEVESALGHLSPDRRLDGLAVSRGPGSFTSLRIGVVTAKALAHRLALPLVGVATTEVVAWPFVQDDGSTTAVILPAWNTAVYVAVYQPGPGEVPDERLPPTAMQPSDAIKRLAETEGELQVVGHGALAHREAILYTLGERAHLATASEGEPDAITLSEAALPRLGRADPEAAFRLRPLYIVPSQAERVAGIDLGMSGAEEGA
jgi:tRNA threonylcarbamoyladenosine biosynthesis protein TsaB